MFPVYLCWTHKSSTQHSVLVFQYDKYFINIVLGLQEAGKILNHLTGRTPKLFPHCFQQTRVLPRNFGKMNNISWSLLSQQTLSIQLVLMGTV